MSLTYFCRTFLTQAQRLLSVISICVCSATLFSSENTSDIITLDRMSPDALRQAADYITMLPDYSITYSKLSYEAALKSGDPMEEYESLQNLGWYYHEIGDMLEALKCYKKIFDLPKTTKTGESFSECRLTGLHRAARLLMVNRKPSEAIPLYNQVYDTLAEDPQTTWTKLAYVAGLRADAMFQAGKQEDASKLLTEELDKWEARGQSYPQYAWLLSMAAKQSRNPFITISLKSRAETAWKNVVDNVTSETLLEMSQFIRGRLWTYGAASDMNGNVDFPIGYEALDLFPLLFRMYKKVPDATKSDRYFVDLRKAIQSNHDLERNSYALKICDLMIADASDLPTTDSIYWNCVGNALKMKILCDHSYNPEGPLPSGDGFPNGKQQAMEYARRTVKGYTDNPAKAPSDDLLEWAIPIYIQCLNDDVQMTQMLYNGYLDVLVRIYGESVRGKDLYQQVIREYSEYMLKSDAPTAVKLTQKALEDMLKETSGVKDMTYCLTLIRKGNAQILDDRSTTRGIKTLNEAISVFERVGVKNHPELERVRHKLAIAYDKQKQFEKADEMFRASLQYEPLPIPHGNGNFYVTRQCDYGLFLSRQNRLQDADAAFTKGTEYCSKRLNAIKCRPLISREYDEPIIYREWVCCLLQKAELQCEKFGAPEKGLELSLQARKLLENYPDYFKNSPNMLNLLEIEAYAAHQAKRYGNQVDPLKEIVRIYTETGRGESIQCAQTLYDLGGAYRDSAQRALAHEAFGKSYKIFRKRNGPEFTKTKEALQRLTDLEKLMQSKGEQVPSSAEYLK